MARERKGGIIFILKSQKANKKREKGGHRYIKTSYLRSLGKEGETSKED